MHLTVLGCSGSFPAPGGACSGYLVEEGKTRLLLDCGNGVLSRLQVLLPIDSLDAIVLSHLHFDHIADLLVLRYAFETRLANGEALRPLPLYLPETPGEIAALLSEGNLFDCRPIRGGGSEPIGDLNLHFFPMRHTVECYAVRIESANGCLTYSGDTLVNEELSTAAKDADLFLCEATSASDAAGDETQIPHLSAAEAARIAREAHVKSLLLTHFWYQQDREVLRREASAIFPAVQLARELETYFV